MPNITPELEARKAGAMIRTFTKENMSVFWLHFKPLLPWIFGLAGFDLVINLLFPQMMGIFSLGGFISNYFYACLAITWHRIVLHGPERADPVNPFKPEKSDLAFMGMGIALPVGLFLIGALFLLPTLIVPAAGLLLVIVIPLLIYVFMRCSFYFPAKAVRAHLSLKDSYKASKGYLWKLMMGGFYAAWRLSLVIAIYSFILSGIINGATAGEIFSHQVIMIAHFLLNLPTMIYFAPLSYVLGIGVLSNYYQHAMQNKTL